MIDFQHDEGNKCLQKQKQVKNEIKDIFKSNPYENKFASAQDPTGKSIVHNVWFEMQNGKVLVQCYNFTKQTNIQPGLDLAIRLKEFADWLNS
jgi:Na+-translocating ferredoxin:NAD+ oxidoreductase RnfG subunit